MLSLMKHASVLRASALGLAPKEPLTIQDDRISPDTLGLWSQGWVRRDPGRAEGTKFGELELCLLVRGKTDQSEYGILKLGCIG